MMHKYTQEQNFIHGKHMQENTTKALFIYNVFQIEEF